MTVWEQPRLGARIEAILNSISFPGQFAAARRTWFLIERPYYVPCNPRDLPISPNNTDEPILNV
jgi:hypothetical protein